MPSLATRPGPSCVRRRRDRDRLPRGPQGPASRARSAVAAHAGRTGNAENSRPCPFSGGGHQACLLRRRVRWSCLLASPVPCVPQRASCTSGAVQAPGEDEGRSPSEAAPRDQAGNVPATAYARHDWRGTRWIVVLTRTPISTRQAAVAAACHDPVPEPVALNAMAARPAAQVPHRRHWPKAAPGRKGHHGNRCPLATRSCQVPAVARISPAPRPGRTWHP